MLRWHYQQWKNFLPIKCELEMSELLWQTFKEGIKYTLEQIYVIWSKDLPDDYVPCPLYWNNSWVSMTFTCLEVLKWFFQWSCMDARVGLWRKWALKNWCFWTAVLEKTLESPLDYKEIQPVHSQGDQPWDFFGRNDAKAETPVLWPPHVKSWLIGKDSDAGRD